MRVALVLRSGGEYRPEHAQFLTGQLREQGHEPLILTDMQVPGCDTAPLRYKWAGWWSCMNIFEPSVKGDLLYMDLDTRLTGDISDIAARRTLTMLDDFYKPGRLQFGVMYLPEWTRNETWERFHEQHISVFRGPGEFMHSIWKDRAKTWQAVLPGQIVSYKCHVMLDSTKRNHVGNGFVPENARVCCFHGKPRPWMVPPLRFAA